MFDANGPSLADIAAVTDRNDDSLEAEMVGGF